jgi:predicted ATPase/DNA-binding CsgD family transcriptional regulator
MSRVSSEQSQTTADRAMLELSRRGERSLALPAPLTSFIGRAKEIAEISTRLQQPGVRLLTLSGAGGTGKTRLAVAAARVLSESFDTVQFVSLATVDDPVQAPISIAHALALRDFGGSVERAIVRRFAHGASLLVIDNLEQILEVGTFLTNLLTHCPGLKILATSRIALRVGGEHEYPVSALAIPDPRSDLLADDFDREEAIALFIDRVRSFQPDFQANAETRPLIAEICRRVDGLPLAIELAAARMKVLSPRALLSRLENRLDVLTGGPRDAPTRQRTMRDTVAWSYDLLTPDEQALLCHISVFNGEIRPESAEAVAAGGALDLFGSLVEKNLLRRTQDTDGEPHFSMLETIRAFAFDQLDAHAEANDYRLRHASYFVGLVEEAAVKLTTNEQAHWYRLLDTEYPNLQAALEWLHETKRADPFARMATALHRYWNVRGNLVEGRGWLRLAIDLAEKEPVSDSVLAGAVLADGLLALNQGDSTGSELDAERGLRLARADNNKRLTAIGLMLAAHLAHRSTDYKTAQRQIEEALALFREIGEKNAIPEALVRLGQEHMDSGELELAAELMVEARDAFLGIGNLQGAGSAIDNLSIVRYSQHRNEEALAQAREATELLREIGSKRGVAVALGHVGKCASRLGDFEASWAAHKEALSLRREIGDARGLAVWLEAAAYLLAALDQRQEAVAAIASADAYRVATSSPLFGNELLDRDHVLGTLRGGLDQRPFKEAWLAGQDRPHNAAIDRAVAAIETALDAPPAVAPVAEETPPFALSRREFEVLGLILKRYGDKEIADMLSISPRTVGRHVGNILAKLGARSRHEAADMIRPYVR